MKKMLLFAALIVLVMSSAALAQIPQIISYQGYMTSGGKPYTGSVDVSFTLYDAEAGGQQAWNQQIAGIQVVQGYYAVIMDFSSRWQPPYWQFDRQYWLEVLLNNKQQLPRVRFAAAPYAMTARKADSAITAYNTFHALKTDTAAVAFKLVQDAPIGTIVAYAGQALGLPDKKKIGWCVCDGSLISRQDFPDYANTIGSIYGTNTGGDSVYLPDYRGLFLRGVNGNRSDTLADPDASGRFALNGHGLAQNQIGSVQMDAFQGHFHQSLGITGSNGSTNWVAPILGQQPSPPDVYGRTSSFAQTPISDGTNKPPRYSSETRPKNAYIFWLIKVK